VKEFFFFFKFAIIHLLLEVISIWGKGDFEECLTLAKIFRNSGNKNLAERFCILVNALANNQDWPS